MSFFVEKVRCAECRDGMVTVTAEMERIRERLLAENPKADVAFVCKGCEHRMMGAPN